MKHAPNGREESQTARDWDPRTHGQTAREWDPRTHERRTKVEIEMLSVKMRQTKFGADAEAKKILAETTQLLESVLVQSSEHTLTSETLKTKLRKVLEKLQELSKENGKDDTELREISQRKFDRAQDLWICGCREALRTHRLDNVSSAPRFRSRKWASQMCGTLKEWDHRWLNNLQYLVTFPT